MFHQPSVVQPSFSLYPNAIPTRLPVLLQRRKSALAGSAVTASAAMMSVAPASARVAAERCRGWRRTPALVYRCFIPPALNSPDGPNAISRELLRTVNEDRPEVVHVGQRRPRRQQIAKFLEEI